MWLLCFYRLPSKCYHFMSCSVGQPSVMVGQPDCYWTTTFQSNLASSGDMIGHTIYHTHVLLPHYQTDVTILFTTRHVLLPHYQTNVTILFTTHMCYYHIIRLMLPYYLPHIYTINTLSELIYHTIFTTHLYYYHIKQLIYHIIYHTLEILPHY